MGLEIFKGLRNASVFERGVYLKAGGDYLLEIEKCLVKETRKSGYGFIVELKVLESKGPDVNPVGSKATWFQSLRDKNVAFGAIKEFMYAVLGLDLANAADKKMIEETIDPQIEQMMEEAIEGGKFNGLQVRVQTSSKLTAAKQVNFTVHTWRPAKA